MSQNDYKVFSHDQAREWGKEHYSNWMIELQDQSHEPNTPAEKFFRYYTQGVHNVFNNTLRAKSIHKYDFDDGHISKSMFIDALIEINKHPISDNILVYRYVHNDLLSHIIKSNGVKRIKTDSILTDKAFLSTTLSLDSVIGRHYANKSEHFLFKILVPKGNFGVYVDLISNMNENEILFPPSTKLKVIKFHRFRKEINCVMINDENIIDNFISSL